MKKTVKAFAEYRIKGLVGYWIDRPADPNEFCGAELDERIVADNDELAIEKAKEIVQAFLEKNKKHCPKEGEEKIKDSEWPKILRFTLTKIIPLWAKEYFPPKPGKPAVPAQPAVSASQSSVDEIVYKDKI
jgi:hypothetical protein